MTKNKKAPSLRPCEVGGVPALFHRWGDEDRAVLHINAFINPSEADRLERVYRARGIVSPGCSLETLRETFALVEYRDGTVSKVKPELVRFVDVEG